MATNSFSAICVFCGSRSGTIPEFEATAKQIGEELLAHKINLVYGGGTVGLMGTVARTVLNGGGTVSGVIPKALSPKEISSEMIGDVTYVKDMHSRKVLMYKKSDAFIAIPGGFGTFEEVMETITWVQLGIHTKPIGILNVAGYYDPLLQQIKNGVKYGFITAETAESIIVVADNPKELLQKMFSQKPPKGFVKWLDEDHL
eukprot:Phypoly_transcript_18772.p1 GENE.Phypoly_transcript_18772~~Phypoly_transcript_18772.p1  ORF type:complete len:201 (+),score=27.87 Phypoly_transcript_18772:137-739(+)